MIFPAQCGDNLWAGNKIHGGGLPVVASGKIAVIRCHNCIGQFGFALRPTPLTNTRATGIGQYRGANLVEHRHLAIALNGCAHALGAGRHHQRHCRFEAVGTSLRRHICRAAHIFVRRIGTTANESGRDLIYKRVAGVRDLGHWKSAERDRGGAVQSHGVRGWTSRAE